MIEYYIEYVECLERISSCKRLICVFESFDEMAQLTSPIEDPFQYFGSYARQRISGHDDYDLPEDC